MSIGIADANTGSLGAFYYGTKAKCPKHGEVSGDFYVYVTDEPAFQTPKLCPKCFVEWTGANVQHVSPTRRAP